MTPDNKGLDVSVYLDAIKVLEECGWCQGTYYGSRKSGPFCLVSALAVASGSEYLTSTESGEAENALARMLNLPLTDHLSDSCLEVFNDDPHTTYEDVVLVLKRAHEANER